MRRLWHLCFGARNYPEIGIRRTRDLALAAWRVPHEYNIRGGCAVMEVFELSRSFVFRSIRVALFWRARPAKDPGRLVILPLDVPVAHDAASGDRSIVDEGAGR